MYGIICSGNCLSRTRSNSFALNKSKFSWSCKYWIWRFGNSGGVPRAVTMTLLSTLETPASIEASMNLSKKSTKRLYSMFNSSELRSSTSSSVSLKSSKLSMQTKIFSFMRTSTATSMSFCGNNVSSMVCSLESEHRMMMRATDSKDP